MNKNTAAFAVSWLISALAGTVFADNGPQLSETKLPPHPAGSITAAFGPSGMGFPTGKLGILVNYLFSQSDGIRFEDSEINNNVELTKHLGLVKLRYGILPGLDIRSATPLYQTIAENNVNNTEKTFGWLGDTTIVAHKVIANQAQGDSMNIALDLGATLPTASVNDDSSDFAGNRTWGLFAGAGATWFAARHRIDGEVNFATFDEGSHTYRKPDRCRVNVGWGYVFTPYLDLGVESNFEWNGESERHDQKQNDSFSEWFVGPKAALRIPAYKMMIGTAMTFPVYRYYDTPTPADSCRFELKISKLF